MKALGRFAVLCACALIGTAASCGGSRSGSAGGQSWGAGHLIEPAALAKELAEPITSKPLLVHVGFKVLYRNGAIPGSIYAGPGQKPEGLDALEAAVKDEPRDREIVIYCGCCPWEDCPNMRPAFERLVDMGYTNVRALHIAKNFETNWVGAGYPVETPKP